MKNNRTHPYMLAEILAAIVLLMILSAAFFTALKTVRKFRSDIRSETIALIAVDNTLERLEYMKTYNASDLEKIFTEEVEKNFQEHNQGVTYKIIRNDDVSTLKLEKQSRVLIEVKIKCVQ